MCQYVFRSWDPLFSVSHRAAVTRATVRVATALWVHVVIQPLGNLYDGVLLYGGAILWGLDEKSSCPLSKRCVGPHTGSDDRPVSLSLHPA